MPIYSGNKIEATKNCIAPATGLDLKNSKEAVEKLAVELEARNPAMFAKQRRQGGAFGTERWASGACLLRLVALFCAGVALIKTAMPCRQAGCNRFQRS